MREKIPEWVARESNIDYATRLHNMSSLTNPPYGN